MNKTIGIHQNTHKFEVSLDAPENQAIASGSPQLAPSGAMGRVDMDGVLVGPLDARGFGIAVVCDIVDVTYLISLLFCSSCSSCPSCYIDTKDKANIALAQHCNLTVSQTHPFHIVNRSIGCSIRVAVPQLYPKPPHPLLTILSISPQTTS